MEKQLNNDIDMMLEVEPKNMMFSAKLIESNKTVDHIQLLLVDKVNLSARIGRVLVGEDEYRNKGIGLEMINLADSIIGDFIL